MNCLLGENATTTANNKPPSTTSAPPSQVNQAKNTPTNNSCTPNSIARLNNNSYNSLNISQNTQLANHSSNTQETCLICGDVASGKHYGLRSCEACKAFFKRTVQGKIEYSCPATRECEINKRRRKACQACRFQKCLNMGMLKEGVRLDRVRGGRQKYRRGLSPGLANGSNANSSTVAGLNLFESGSATSNHHHHLSVINSNEGNNLTNSCISGQQQTSSNIGTPLGATNLGTSETTRMMTALISCEPDELTASPAQFIANIPSSLSIQMKTLYILSDLFDRELVSLIGWAKQIPGFTETITLNDQMRLLQSTWAEVIALSIGYRSHLKRVEAFKLQHGNASNSINSNNYYHFINTTPSPTSSSPASTASGYNQNICSNNNNSSNINSSYSSISSSSPSSTYSYNLENIEIKLVFAKDLVIDFKHAVACGAEEIFYNCVQLIKRLDCLKITPKEFILLKAVSLTNADVRLENPKAIHQLRDLLMDTLYEVTLADSSIQASLSSSLNDITDSGINTGSNGIQLKIEAQELSSNSLHPYASTSSPRPSSSALSSSPSKGSPSCNTNNSNNNSQHQINLGLNNNSVNKRVIINNRMNQVLLCLPVLRQIDSCIRKFWNDVRKGANTVPMNKLFEEMLEPCQRIHKSTL